MSETPAERRLAAIMAADVVGYSRLIETGEAATLAEVRLLRSRAKTGMYMTIVSQVS
jgi:class 3 adenylate cyclase